jgi:RNA polymerase sigma factor (sigma-70 family)
MSSGPDRDPAERGRQARLSLLSFDTFYRRYRPILVRYLISQANDTSWAEDVAQETMLDASDRWDDLLTYERPDSWLFTVATRKLRRLEARARERCCLPENLGRAEGDLRVAAATDAWVDDHLDLVAALRSLPRRQGEVIGLHFLADYTIAETALILGMSEGTAKTHLRRGLEQLRRHESARRPVLTQQEGPHGDYRK